MIIHNFGLFESVWLYYGELAAFTRIYTRYKAKGIAPRRRATKGLLAPLLPKPPSGSAAALIMELEVLLLVTVTVNMRVDVRYKVRILLVVIVLVLVERTLRGLVTVRVVVTSFV